MLMTTDVAPTSVSVLEGTIVIVPPEKVLFTINSLPLEAFGKVTVQLDAGATISSLWSTV